MAPLLEVEGLSVFYDRLPALSDVAIAVPEGSVVAVLGPNGAGKTTLLRTIAGLVTPAAGTVRLDGRSLEGMAPHSRAAAGVCLIPEGRGVFPALTVAENIAVALDNDETRANEVYDFFPILRSRRQQLAGTLSGGEQQMLALARAIGSEPRLLMADELSLGLAPMLVRTIHDALRRLHDERGLTVLVVEQYARQALQLADFVAILNRGRLVWAGEPDELRASQVLVDTYLGTA
jgi:branched-chain amino acid transport system ATP-binding protein